MCWICDLSLAGRGWLCGLGKVVGDETDKDTGSLRYGGKVRRLRSR